MRCRLKREKPLKDEKCKDLHKAKNAHFDAWALDIWAVVLQHASMTKKTSKPKAATKAAAPAKASKADKVEKPPVDKMNKSELVNKVTEETGITKKDANNAVDAVLNTIIAALKAGKSVSLPGLGTLSVKETAARKGVRPGTSDVINIPAGKKVAFKVSTTLKGEL